VTKKLDPAPAAAPLSSLGDLLRARGVPVAAAEARVALPSAPAQRGQIDLSAGGKLVVRRERSGRGGKTVTVVAGLSLPPPRLDDVARAMRKALGCGSWVEDGQVVLQGDRAAAADAWLRQHGARQVTRGN
jgi:translation initiation factor 1